MKIESNRDEIESSRDVYHVPPVRYRRQWRESARESRGGTGTHELVTFSKIQGLLENMPKNTQLETAFFR